MLTHPTVVRSDKLRKCLENRPPLIQTYDPPEVGMLYTLKQELRARFDGPKPHRSRWDMVKLAGTSESSSAAAETSSASVVSSSAAADTSSAAAEAFSYNSSP